MTEQIFVTKPFLPPLEEFTPLLEQIWANGWLTNNGPMHEELEQALAGYLGVPHVSLFNNGTIALLTALQALELTGEVITTPYTFVATANALVWNKLTPVFVDVGQDCNIDPEKVEAAITSRTSAILPVHCYGMPCDHERLSAIAQKHQLKLIYDAAHTFGARDDNGISLCSHGDLSILSFHATKVFNTFEGGAIVSHDASMKRRIDRLKNFGFENETTVSLAGINGKMNEVCAAFGLLQLKHVDAAIEGRRQVEASYRKRLDQGGVRMLPPRPTDLGNSAYFPIFVDDRDDARDRLYHQLKSKGIYCRRYFYPLLTDFPMYTNLQHADLPVAQRLAREVLCLPMYSDVGSQTVDKICRIVLKQLRRGV